jgi:CheY-like chemotaxis protein
MDLGMPDIDGLAVTKVIRGLEEGSKLPIIAVTAYGVDDSQALEAGCNELIFKPIDVLSLEPILSKYLAK